jgi:hypothetical protein
MTNISCKFTQAAAIACFGLGVGFAASPALATVLTRQDFNGNFTLVDSRSLGDPFPESTGYSGFVLYDENDSLLDWAINVDELDLQLDPDSAQTADVTFEENSLDWTLRIDFGIAFDAPLYTIQRSADTGITFDFMAFGPFASYADSAPNIAITNSPRTSVPEPSTLLALFTFVAAIPILKKKA